LLDISFGIHIISLSHKTGKTNLFEQTLVKQLALFFYLTTGFGAKALFYNKITYSRLKTIYSHRKFR
jgi:hypothetical protein